MAQELLLDSEDSELLLDSLDSEDAELLLDSLDSEDAELLLDSLDSEDAELLLDELEDSGPVGLPLLQPASVPAPARAAPPESRIKNSRRFERRSDRLRVRSPSSCFFTMTPAF